MMLIGTPYWQRGRAPFTSLSNSPAAAARHQYATLPSRRRPCRGGASSGWRSARCRSGCFCQNSPATARRRFGASSICSDASRETSSIISPSSARRSGHPSARVTSSVPARPGNPLVRAAHVVGSHERQTQQARLRHHHGTRGYPAKGTQGHQVVRGTGVHQPVGRAHRDVGRGQREIIALLRSAIPAPPCRRVEIHGGDAVGDRARRDALATAAMLESGLDVRDCAQVSSRSWRTVASADGGGHARASSSVIATMTAILEVRHAHRVEAQLADRLRAP